MTLLAPKVREIYPIGSIIEANAPLSNNWLHCDGSILAQADYPALYALMENPHPQMYSHWNFVDDFDTGGDSPYGERVQWNGSTGSPIWVAACTAGKAARSTDGITWAFVSLPSTGSWYGPAWNGSVFCATKRSSTEAATSSDGSSWTSRTLSYSYYWQTIVWDGTYFLAIPQNNVQVIKSTDGASWSDAGVLSKTGYYYGASDGDGLTVVIDNGGEIEYSDDNGSNWNYVRGATGSWYSVEYCNGYFLIATGKAYVGISDNGADWSFVPFAGDTHEAIDNFGYVAPTITRWRYYNGIYFGLSSNTPWGVYSFDLRTFHPWFCNPHFSEFYDIVYNSTSDNLTIFGDYGYSMPYTSKIENYTESTHFQLPLKHSHRHVNRGVNYYIRVK